MEAGRPLAPGHSRADERGVGGTGIEGMGSDQRRAALCEVRAIERSLRRFAEEKAEFEANHALRGLLGASLRDEPGTLDGCTSPTAPTPATDLQLHPSSLLPGETRGEAWRRLSAQIAEYESKHAERQRAVGELVMRLEALRPHLVS